MTEGEYVVYMPSNKQYKDRLLRVGQEYLLLDSFFNRSDTLIYMVEVVANTKIQKCLGATEFISLAEYRNQLIDEIIKHNEE